MKKILAYLFSGLLCCACIYPFEAQTADVEKRVVIDGDIIAGDSTRVDVRYLQNLNSEKLLALEARPKGNCWIEDNHGNKYYKVYSESGNHFVFDTRDLNLSYEYCVVYHDSESNKYYRSSFLPVAKAPDIDKIYYVLSDTDCMFYVDLTGHHGCRYYRWDFSQTWEYIADFAPTVYYNPYYDSIEYLRGDHGSDYNTFYCWNKSAGLVEYNVGESESQNTYSLKSQEITKIDRKSKKLSMVYRMELVARGMSADAYDYMNNLKKMSSISGSLFSPNPSDILGNIKCQEDTTEIVYGYINVCTVSRDTLYVSADKVYHKPYSNSLLFLPDFNNLYTQAVAYIGGLRPVYKNEASGEVQWATSRCVDCLGYGGFAERPEGWPTNHTYNPRVLEEPEDWEKPEDWPFDF